MVSLFLREIAQFGRALRSGRRGRRFKSDFPDIQAIHLGSFFLFKNRLYFFVKKYPLHFRRKYF